MQETINRLRDKKDDEGFTLIELLVVVVIIGVLVAIAVPVYLNYRKGAADKSAQSDVRGAISAIEQYYTDNNNAYPASLASQTTTFAVATGSPQKITLSDKTTLSYILVGTTAYKICATNSGGSDGTTAGLTKVYLYDSAAGGSVKVPAPAVAIATCA